MIDWTRFILTIVLVVPLLWAVTTAARRKDGALFWWISGFTFGAAFLFLATPVHARERQLHGVGPEGEVVEISMRTRGEFCHERETAARGTWPDGTVRQGCHIRRTSVHAPTLIRWRGENDQGQPVEWTVEYLGLAVRYVSRP